MKFDVIITHIGSPKAKNIIARHLAHDPSISLQKALSLLETPPIVYMTGLLKDDALYQVRQLEKIQVSAKCVEVQLGPLLPHAVAPFVPEHAASLDPPPQPVQHPGMTKPVPVTEPALPSSGAPASQNASPAIRMTKKNIIVVSSVCVAIVITAITVLALKGAFNWGHAFALDWSKSGLVSADSQPKKTDTKKTKPERGTTGSIDTANDRDKNSGPDSTLDPDEPSDELKGKAEACVDSGKNSRDLAQSVAFYQLAIAFNKRNVTAWYALHDAYVSANMSSEAETTDKAMRKLFGDNIFSVAKIIEPFGTAISTSLTRDGIYRVEYQSRESNPSKGLADSYLLVKALKNSCLCSAISMYARTTAGKGMLVYVRTESFPASFEEFKASANITYLK